MSFVNRPRTLRSFLHHNSTFSVVKIMTENIAILAHFSDINLIMSSHRWDHNLILNRNHMFEKNFFACGLKCVVQFVEQVLKYSVAYPHMPFNHDDEYWL